MNPKVSSAWFWIDYPPPRVATIIVLINVLLLCGVCVFSTSTVGRSSLIKRCKETAAISVRAVHMTPTKALTSLRSCVDSEQLVESHGVKPAPAVFTGLPAQRVKHWVLAPVTFISPTSQKLKLCNYNPYNPSKYICLKTSTPRAASLISFGRIYTKVKKQLFYSYTPLQVSVGYCIIMTCMSSLEIWVTDFHAEKKKVQEKVRFFKYKFRADFL